jgi:RNA polymerase sigma-70 factor (ECF subfamily)
VGRLLVLRIPGHDASVETDERARDSGILPGSPDREEAQDDDGDLIRLLRARSPHAGDLLVDRCRKHVERVLFRVMGRTDALADLTQDVFLAVLEGIDSLREDARFRGWLTQVIVFVARGSIRKRRRKWWLVFTDVVPEQNAEEVDSESSEALRAVYDVLDQMDPDDRIAFALRKIDGMELTEVASACAVSLATIKRRLLRAEASFLALAAKRDVLAPWLESGAT